jgi:hypothetical protein
VPEKLPIRHGDSCEVRTLVLWLGLAIAMINSGAPNTN